MRICFQDLCSISPHVSRDLRERGLKKKNEMGTDFSRGVLSQEGEHLVKILYHFPQTDLTQMIEIKSLDLLSFCPLELKFMPKTDDEDSESQFLLESDSFSEE
jgi:hypothetical protein